MRFFFKCEFNIQAVVIANKSNNKTNHIKALLSLKRCPQIELNTIVIMYYSSYISPTRQFYFSVPGQNAGFRFYFPEQIPYIETANRLAREKFFHSYDHNEVSSTK